MTYSNLESICNALGITVIELITWEDNKESAYLEKLNSKELQRQVKELTTARDIAQHYVEDLKRKNYSLDAIFQSTIQYIGKEANLGREELVDEDDIFVMYSTAFTDKELMSIFEIIFNDQPILYNVFKDIVQRDVIDTTRRMAKLFLKYINQKNRTFDR